MNADETVFFSESISGFQKNIVTVQDSLNKMFDIDLRKIKIVVFRNRGLLKENDKGYLNSKMIEICDQFVYLDVFLNQNNTFNVTQKNI